MAVDAETVAPAVVRREARRRSGGAGVGPWLTLASYLSLLLVWVLAARAAPNLIPGPVETLEFVAREYQRAVLIKHLLVTTQRVLSAFAVGMVIGVAAGAAMGASKRVDDLLQGWLVVLLTIPRILLFVVAYLTVGLSDRALVIALVITVVPTIVVAVREGARAIDRSLVDMAKAFRRSRTATWAHVVFPQLTQAEIETMARQLAAGGHTITGDAALRRVLVALAPARALIVGGAVRNALLGEPVSDIDIATDARPERVVKRSSTATRSPATTPPVMSASDQVTLGLPAKLP